MISNIAHRECCKNEPVTGISCVRDLYLLGCSSKTYCRGNTYLLPTSLRLHDTAMVQREHKYWHSWHTSLHLENLWKSICNLPIFLRLPESPTFNTLWAAVKYFLTALLLGLRKQLQTISKQLPSPLPMDFICWSQMFPSVFHCSAHFYCGHYNCRLQKYQSLDFHSNIIKIAIYIATVLTADQKSLTSVLFTLCISMPTFFRQQYFRFIKWLTKLARLLLKFSIHNIGGFPRCRNHSNTQWYKTSLHPNTLLTRTKWKLCYVKFITFPIHLADRCSNTSKRYQKPLLRFDAIWKDRILFWCSKRTSNYAAISYHSFSSI